MHSASLSVFKYEDGRVGFTAASSIPGSTVLGQLKVKDGPLPSFEADFATLQDLFGALTPGTWTFSPLKKKPRAA